VCRWKRQRTIYEVHQENEVFRSEVGNPRIVMISVKQAGTNVLQDLRERNHFTHFPVIAVQSLMYDETPSPYRSSISPVKLRQTSRRTENGNMARVRRGSRQPTALYPDGKPGFGQQLPNGYPQCRRRDCA
jgi:hypothetical protein